MATTCAARVRPIAAPNSANKEKRRTARQRCRIEATSRPLEVVDTMGWGGSIADISVSGLKLSLCFPFRAGTYLAIDLQSRSAGTTRSLVCRVVHVQDHSDGTWTLGCEFVEPLSAGEVALLT
jgi:hypothetical protein